MDIGKINAVNLVCFQQLESTIGKACCQRRTAWCKIQERIVLTFKICKVKYSKSVK